MIIDYESKYDEQIKDLFFELQQYIVALDKEKYNIITDEFKEKYFAKTIEDIKSNSGKILLAEENSEIVGLVAGIINNDECADYDFKVPKRGRITELIVSENCRSKGVGTLLLKAMERYLHSIGCKDILISVFAYNESAVNFYEKNGYRVRVIDMMKGRGGV